MNGGEIICTINTTMEGCPQVYHNGGSLVAFLHAALVTGFNSKAVDSLSQSNGIAIAVISSGHTWQVGDVISIDGANESGFNVSKGKVTERTASTVTFRLLSTPEEQSATGSITIKTAPLGWIESSLNDGNLSYGVRQGAPDSSGFFLNLFKNDAERIHVFLTKEPMIDFGYLVDIGWYLAPANDASYTIPVWIIGDDKTFIINIAWLPRTYPTLFTPYYCGEFDSNIVDDANSVYLSGNTNYHYSSPSYGSYHFMNAIGGNQYNWIPSDYLGSNVYIQPTRKSTFIVNSGNGGLLYPNPKDDSIYLDKISLLESSSDIFRGTLRGCYAVANDIKGLYETGVIRNDFYGSLENRDVLFIKTFGAGSNPGAFCIDTTGPW